MGICDGRVVIVTGSGRGLGQAHALEFARQGAKVVVNDLGVAQDGSDPSDTPAQQVVDEIAALGGEAVTSSHDVSDWDAARVSTTDHCRWPRRKHCGWRWCTTTIYLRRCRRNRMTCR